ncbi:hypothetical protein [Egbenema bharatensis]|uniref:hypothetical protein n=1 Tax=Egbenema bharatensis TaxID=3463334 RepID=UPI003A8A0F9E
MSYKPCYSAQAFQLAPVACWWVAVPMPLSFPCLARLLLLAPLEALAFTRSGFWLVGGLAIGSTSRLTA